MGPILQSCLYSKGKRYFSVFTKVFNLFRLMLILGIYAERFLNDFI
jgi:hypothetical protein